MNGKRHIGKLLISIGLILIFISSSTRYIPEFKYLTDYLFLIGGLFIVSYGLISLIRKDVEINRTFNNLTLIYGIFIIFVIISTFVNQNLEREVDALVKFILMYFFLNLFLMLTEITTKRLIINTFVISSIVVFSYFLINYPIAVSTVVYKFGFVIFIIFVIISTFVNQNLEREVDALVKFILMYFFLNLFLMLTEITTKRLIINTFVISSIVVFSYFLINYPIAESTGAYKGGFGNPNSIGVLAVTLFSVSLVAGTSLLKNKRSYILASIYLLIAIAAGYLTLISNSRTSFITLVIVFGIVAMTFIYDVLKGRHLLSWKSIIVV